MKENRKDQDWKSMIPGCFGSVDRTFCSHKGEESRAKELLKIVLDQNVTITTFSAAIEDFLESKVNKDKDFIKEQIDSALNLKTYMDD